jgi:hypothetical protein
MTNFEALKEMDNGTFCETLIDAGFYYMTVKEFCKWLKEKYNEI